ncbi:hypothetical protein P4I92_27855 [Bacillus cereus]
MNFYQELGCIHVYYVPLVSDLSIKQKTHGL